MKKDMVKKVSGFIEEDELISLANGDNATGGATPATVVLTATIGLTGTTFTVTLSAASCPTSACTKQCNK
ncbi:MULTISPECIES: class II lanthipeptide, LchA2/BrtA2 family [Bacillus]|uniref:class II lanthipeptide, LchA2/BrtA2 family n=1 Tax=Bacillus TaxID=1386 RepID=UPI000397AF07|nr:MULTISPECIES: class II lanthipeptide, LchA2/BrtA2 family [Bacillus]ERH50301.1 hypothetical protein O205_15165 [Bacillus amyloliquefaciens EGD-AQ14]